MTLKYEFHEQKSSILIKDLDLNEKVVYNKFPFGKKHFIFFIGYKDKEIRLLYIFFLEMSTCKRYSNNNKCMYFIINIG